MTLKWLCRGWSRRSLCRWETRDCRLPARSVRTSSQCGLCKSGTDRPSKQILRTRLSHWTTKSVEQLEIGEWSHECALTPDVWAQLALLLMRTLKVMPRGFLSSWIRTSLSPIVMFVKPRLKSLMRELSMRFSIDESSPQLLQSR